MRKDTKFLECVMRGSTILRDKSIRDRNLRFEISGRVINFCKKRFNLTDKQARSIVTKDLKMVRLGKGSIIDYYICSDDFKKKVEKIFK